MWATLIIMRVIAAGALLAAAFLALRIAALGPDLTASDAILGTAIVGLLAALAAALWSVRP